MRNKRLFLFIYKKTRDIISGSCLNGALDRTRTGTGLKPADFESAMSTNFITRAVTTSLSIVGIKQFCKIKFKKMIELIKNFLF